MFSSLKVLKGSGLSIGKSLMHFIQPRRIRELDYGTVRWAVDRFAQRDEKEKELSLRA